MTFDPAQWLRLQWDDTPIYVRPDPPNWFVPNDPGDRILKKILAGPSPDPRLAERRFFDRLPDATDSVYAGRINVLKLGQLRELWLHVTNRCNLSCRHCLFGSSPGDALELPVGHVLEAAGQAADLGCRVFALTGGEPFLHPDFPSIVEGLLALAETHVVVLSNGLAARRVLERNHWDPDRLHLQISLDGLEHGHDAIRGAGTFARTMLELQRLSRNGVPFTLSVCPTRRNLGEIPELVDLAAEVGAANLHFMWYFVRGRGISEQFVEPAELYPVVRDAVERAERHGLNVDNVESLASQVFAPAGTRHDGASAAWESLALGPDGRIYPSAALVGVPELASEWRGSLAMAWKESPVLERIRRQTAASLDHPLRFLLGGGDPDHSYIHGGRFMGEDPYLGLQQEIALWLIARRASQAKNPEHPALRLKMGDIVQSCGSQGGVAFIHSNCLLALAAPSSLTVVRDFYGEAAVSPKEDILNPVCYPAELVQHIPEEYRFRGYGCGSPVVDADIRAGETVVDLGCGHGVECFIAARLAGPAGRVIGIDMLEPMLQRARAGAEAVSRNLGYENLAFHQCLLESLPLEEMSADVVVSNCVLNLCADKRKAFDQIYRVLRPGGRLVVSDVVCDIEPDAAIRNDPVLHGECIGGALTQKDLAGLLNEAGFGPLQFLKRFPYRQINGHPFYSLTFEARKPATGDPVSVVYRGPFAAVQSPAGTYLTPGPVVRIAKWEAETLQDHLFILDGDGTVINQAGQSSCACAAPPETGSANRAPGTDRDGQSGSRRFKVSAPSGGATGTRIAFKRRFGCMVCGAPLSYEETEAPAVCAYCGHSVVSNAQCENGHFVCDACHSEDALSVIEQVALTSFETDLIALMEKIRRHPAIPVHGPEHHALVPAVIVAAYRNAGGAATDADIRTALRRGSQVPGGSCGFMGCCGAAVGVGIAFSILVQANPVKPLQRKIVQQATQAVLAEIGALEAARCCQRDVWIALRKAAELSRDLLERPLNADHPLRCRQQLRNPECLGAACPVTKNLNGHLAVGMPARHGGSRGI